jgi:hypothetical protein
MAKVSKEDPVAVEHIDGQWAVQVFENGQVYQRLFESKEFANNFAAGQLLRLRPRPLTDDTSADFQEEDSGRG